MVSRFLGGAIMTIALLFLAVQCTRILPDPVLNQTQFRTVYKPVGL